MREPEQFIIPAFGVLVLLSVFILGTGFYSLTYPVILGVLGLAAIGTFFLPSAVQVELRIAISGLGLLTLIFMFSSLVVSHVCNRRDRGGGVWSWRPGC